MSYFKACTRTKIGFSKKKLLIKKNDSDLIISLPVCLTVFTHRNPCNHYWFGRMVRSFKVFKVKKKWHLSTKKKGEACLLVEMKKFLFEQPPVIAVYTVGLFFQFRQTIQLKYFQYNWLSCTFFFLFPMSSIENDGW